MDAQLEVETSQGKVASKNIGGLVDAIIKFCASDELAARLEQLE